ncbi:unnamed protein product, partial [Mycena citricolor]
TSKDRKQTRNAHGTERSEEKIRPTGQHPYCERYEDACSMSAAWPMEWRIRPSADPTSSARGTRKKRVM